MADKAVSPPLLRPELHLLAAYWDALVRPGEVHEVRIPKTRRGPAKLFGTVAGYFNDRGAFVRALQEITGGDAEAVYMTLNPVRPDLLARANNRLVSTRTTAKDQDVPARRHLLIDIDPTRPAEMQSTDAERDLALQTRDKIRAYLGDQDWPEPVMTAMTGNGGALVYRLDLPNDLEAEQLVRIVLQALARLFDNEQATVDQKVTNASRISKVIGTIAAKGDHVPDLGRVWRRATADFQPGAQVVERGLLDRVAAQALELSPPREQGNDASTERGWSVAELLEQNDVGWQEVIKPYGTVYKLDRCLTSDEHEDGAAITEMLSGALAYQCFHRTCEGRKWADAKVALGLGQGSGHLDFGTEVGADGVGDPHATGGPGVSSFLRFFAAGSVANFDGATDLPDAPPFPTEVLPGVVRDLVTEGAKAVAVPPEMIAVPLLTFAGSTLGNTYSIVLKEGFEPRPILYTAVVAQPGSAKSPALELARYPLDVLQQEALNEYREAMQEHQEELARWSGIPKEERGPRPAQPIMESLFTTDATIEAIAALLERSNGLTLVQDEIVAWVKSHDAYRGGKGGDRQRWLSLWAGSPLKVDRKGSEPIYVPNPVIGVTGGVQPDVLHLLADEAGRRDGFIDRLLWAYPQVRAGKWTEETTPQATKNAVTDLFRQLRRDRLPVQVHLSTAARQAWIAWYNANADRTDAAAGLTQGIYAKLGLQAGRLMLILHCLAQPHKPEEHLVSEETAQAALTLAEYFRAQAHRVIPKFEPRSDGAGEKLELPDRVVQILALAGDWLDRTDMHARLGRHVRAGDLDVALADLKAMGLAEARTVPTGGRPAEQWRWLGTLRKNEESPMAQLDYPENLSPTVNGAPAPVPSLQGTDAERNDSGRPDRNEVAPDCVKVLAEARAAGLQVSVAGDWLEIRPSIPLDQLPSSLTRALEQCKSVIVAGVANPPARDAGQPHGAKAKVGPTPYAHCDSCGHPVELVDDTDWYRFACGHGGVIPKSDPYVRKQIDQATDQ